MKKAASVNIKVIARRAGVSIATVSRVVNRKDLNKVGDETRKRVLRICEKARYRPNGVARALVTRKSRTICFACDHFESLKHPYLAGILAGIGHVLEEKNYYLQLAVSQIQENDSLHRPHYLQLTEEQGIAGLIVYGEESRHEDLKRLQKDGMPMVLVNFAARGLEIPSVMPNFREGAIDAAIALSRPSRRSYIFFAGNLRYQSDQKKLSGFKRALSDLGVAANRLKVLETNYDAAATYRMSCEVLTNIPLPCAVMAVDDECAHAVLQAGRELGLRVPKDLSVAGFNDVSALTIFSIPITSVSVDVDQMGRIAAQLLLDRIDRGRTPRSSLVSRIPVKLVMRQSTAPDPLRIREPRKEGEKAFPPTAEKVRSEKRSNYSGQAYSLSFRA